jgi:hypothetical protein
MAASNIPVVEPSIDAVDWAALACLMGIPDSRRENYIERLQWDIGVEWVGAGSPPPKLPLAWRRREEIDAEIARAGSALIQALEARCEASEPPDDLSWEIANTVRADLDRLQLRTPRRGESENEFALFVQRVLFDVCIHGGRVVFNARTNPARGNIVDLLVQLRPMLPPDFMPKDCTTSAT